MVKKTASIRELGAEFIMLETNKGKQTSLKASPYCSCFAFNTLFFIILMPFLLKINKYVIEEVFNLLVGFVFEHHGLHIASKFGYKLVEMIEVENHTVVLDSEGVTGYSVTHIVVAKEGTSLALA